MLLPERESKVAYHSSRDLSTANQPGRQWVSSPPVFVSGSLMGPLSSLTLSLSPSSSQSRRLSIKPKDRNRGKVSYIALSNPNLYFPGLLPLFCP